MQVACYNVHFFLSGNLPMSGFSIRTVILVTEDLEHSECFPVLQMATTSIKVNLIMTSAIQNEH